MRPMACEINKKECSFCNARCMYRKAEFNVSANLQAPIESKCPHGNFHCSVCLDICPFRTEDYSVSKPKLPIGIIPKNMWEHERRINLVAAMKRYFDAGLKVPKEWVDEYNELLIKGDKLND